MKKGIWWRELKKNKRKSESKNTKGSAKPRIDPFKGCDMCA